MRTSIYLLALAIISCNNQLQERSDPETFPPTQPASTADPKDQRNKDICWAGTLNGKTPVFIHYRLDNNVIIGDIIYLNTKGKLPIKLLGTVADDKSYRLLEFDKTGSITGIIEGKPTEKEFTGTWVSPKAEKELGMKLLPKDTLISSPSVRPDPSRMFGGYHYQYGENGYSGDFEFTKVEDGKAAFHILSLTNVERGPNVAEVEKDTVALTGTGFIYKVPGSGDCTFNVTFYEGFVYISYTGGRCESQFGVNATIEGIYIKTR